MVAVDSVRRQRRMTYGPVILEQSRSPDSSCGGQVGRTTGPGLGCPASKVIIRQRVSGRQRSIGEAWDEDHDIPLVFMRESKACDRADAPAQLVDERQLRQPPSYWRYLEPCRGQACTGARSRGGLTVRFRMGKVVSASACCRGRYALRSAGPLYMFRSAGEGVVADEGVRRE